MRALAWLVLLFAGVANAQTSNDESFRFRCKGVSAHDQRIIGHAEVSFVTPKYAVFIDYTENPSTIFEMFDPKPDGDLLFYKRDFRRILFKRVHGVYSDVRIFVDDSFGECHQIPNHLD